MNNMDLEFLTYFDDYFRIMKEHNMSVTREAHKEYDALAMKRRTNDNGHWPNLTFWFFYKINRLLSAEITRKKLKGPTLNITMSTFN